eukprot:9176545-Alexandrium_andersonii.AAC.1
MEQRARSGSPARDRGAPPRRAAEGAEANSWKQTGNARQPANLPTAASAWGNPRAYARRPAES